MKQESMAVGLIDGEIPVVEHHPMMTEEFTKIYQEALALSNVQVHEELKFRNVAIYEKDHMHEVYSTGKNLPHLVLLHGYGGTSLTFVRMFEYLMPHFQVHALDTFGIGLSSRGNWSNNMNSEQAGKYYIEAIEEWRKKIGLQSFILAGHSFGGYISTLYFEKYPERIKQLMLLSPAGTARFTQEEIEERSDKAPYWFCFMEKIYNMNLRPSKVMNSCYFGNKLIDRILKGRLKLPEHEQIIWRKYMKHVINQSECSEKGFYILFDWPLQPTRSIEGILGAMKPTIPIDFMYGDDDWMRPAGAVRLAKDFENIQVHEVEKAGHQMLFENPQFLSNIMKKILKLVS